MPPTPESVALGLAGVLFGLALGLLAWALSEHRRRSREGAVDRGHEAERQQHDGQGGSSKGSAQSALHKVRHQGKRHAGAKVAKRNKRTHGAKLA